MYGIPFTSHGSTKIENEQRQPNAESILMNETSAPSDWRRRRRRRRRTISKCIPSVLRRFGSKSKKTIVRKILIYKESYLVGNVLLFQEIWTRTVGRHLVTPPRYLKLTEETFGQTRSKNETNPTTSIHTLSLLKSITHVNSSKHVEFWSFWNSYLIIQIFWLENDACHD